MAYKEYVDNLDGTVTIKDDQNRDVVLPFNNPDVQEMLKQHYSPAAVVDPNELGGYNNPIASGDTSLFTKKEPFNEIVRKNPFGEDPNALRQLDRNGEYSAVPTEADARRYLGQDATDSGGNPISVAPAPAPAPAPAQPVTVNVPPQETTYVPEYMKPQISGTPSIPQAPKADTRPFSATAKPISFGGGNVPPSASEEVLASANSGVVATTYKGVTGETMPKQDTTGNPFAQTQPQPRSSNGGGGYMTKGGMIPAGIQETRIVYDPKLQAELKDKQAKVDDIEIQNTQDRGRQAVRSNELMTDAEEKAWYIDRQNKDWEARNKWLVEYENDELKKKQKALENMKVDPDKYWTDQSVPQRLGLTIAAVMYDYGNGLIAAGGKGGANGRNAILDNIDKAIDRNIDAQKQNIMNARGNLDNAQKEWLKQYNMFQDERQYREAVKYKVLSDAKNVIQSEKDKTENEIVKRNADNAIAFIDLERTKAQFEATKVQQTTTGKYVPPQYVGGSGVGSGHSKVDKEIREMGEKTKDMMKIIYAAKQLRAASKGVGDTDTVPGVGTAERIVGEGEIMGAALDAVQDPKKVQTRQTVYGASDIYAHGLSGAGMSEREAARKARTNIGNGTGGSIRKGADNMEGFALEQIDNATNGYSPEARAAYYAQHGLVPPEARQRNNAPAPPPASYKPKK